MISYCWYEKQASEQKRPASMELTGLRY